LSDGAGPRSALILVGLGSALFGTLTGALGLVITTASLILPALLIVRGLDGACMAPLYPAAGRAVSLRVPFHRRALANGLVTGAAPLGVACAYPLFAQLIDRLGWPTAFQITGLCTAGLAILWALCSRDPPDSPTMVHLDPEEIEATARRAAPWAGPYGRSLWLLTLSYAAIGYFEYLLYYWSEYYFRQVLGFGAAESRVAALLPPLAEAAGMPLGGWISDRLVGLLGYRRGRAVVAGLAMAASALLLSLGTVVASPVGVAACFTLALGAIGLCQGAAWATAIELGGRRGGTSAAIVNTGGNVGGFIAPVVTPWIGTLLSWGPGPKAGWAWGLRLGCLICMLGACLWFWINPEERD
jgi:MFS family permease